MSNPQSYTIWSPQDTVKDVAESLGLDNVNEDVLKALAMDVEYRILEIIEQAVKFKRHSKSDILTTDDVAKALRVLNVEPLYGYHSSIGPVNHSSHIAGNNSSNINGTIAPEGKQSSFVKVQSNGMQPIYYLNEDEVDFDKLINEPLPPVPRLPTFTTHWLAIEGIQPRIIQNPDLNEIRTTIPPTTRGAIVTALNDNSIQTSSSNMSTPNTLLKGANKVKNSNDKSMTFDEKVNKIQSISSVKPGHNTEVKPLVKHVLSKELQIYFDKVIEALTTKADSNNPEVNDKTLHMKQAALTSLKTDSGLHQLVPYFIQFIAEQITHNLSDLELLTSILEMIYSIVNNPSIFLEPYIHSLMPSILTLLLAKKLGGTPNENKNSNNNSNSNNSNSKNTDSNETDTLQVEKDPNNVVKSTNDMKNNSEETNDTNNSLREFIDQTNSLRDFAATLLQFVLGKFPQIYKSLKPRVTRTLLKTFLDTNRVFGTYYGCLKGIGVLQSETIRFFLGNIYNWTRLVFNEQNLTLDDMEKNDGINPNIKKFTNLETELLINTIIETLSILKKDLPEIYDDKKGMVSTEEREKLVKRCGVTVSYHILKRDDAKTFISAIFFGE